MIESQKKLILIITPRKKGGPWQWGKDLVDNLNESGKFQAEHVFTIKDKILSPFRRNIALIHTTNPLAWSVFFKPIILTIHGKPHGWLWKFFYCFGYLKASVVTIPSEFLKKSLKLKKAVIIPNAIDISKFAIADLLERDFFNILTVTKFWFPGKAKGLFELAQIIFNLAKDFDKRINWRIVGFGPLLDDIKKSVGALEKPESINVQWFGFDLPQKYFSDSDIFAYFSYEDNMPIAVMEAMASGLPVVTNKVGAISEIIDSEKDGFIASDHQDYQNILLKLMNNFSLRREIGKAARKKIEDKFGWETVLPRWIELYKKVIK
jgi:glycosyltransferase involved in cell wall biosynthesis